MSKKLKNIVRYALTCVFLFTIGTAAAQQTITGTIVDSTGEPVIGATVKEQGTTNAAVTDFDGNFSLSVSGKKPVEISYIGMKTKTVDVAGKSSINVTLEDEANDLNEVVVIGYGTVQKKDLTGSVASIKSDKLEDIPVSNVGEAMTGKLAGVNVTTTEGSPDADVKIRVRGGGSLSQDNSPLYIVDGFPVASISDISPTEIESIDVLKDASATAIYGAQGANGVIIVTTKSGKEGNIQVNFNGSLAWKQITKTIGVLDPYEYAYYRFEQENPTQPFSNSTTAYGQFSDVDLWKGVEGRDYQDELFGRTGLQKQFGVNVSGGSKELKFNVGYQHIDEESIMRGSGYAKNNINAKLNAKLNKWLTLDFTARLAQSKIEGLSGGTDTNDSNASNSTIARAIYWYPIEGLSSMELNDDDETSNADPIERLDERYKVQNRFIQTYNGALNWKPWKGWTFRTEVGFNWRYYDTDEAWGSRSGNKEAGGNPMGQFTHQVTKNWRNANTVTYDNKKLFGGRDHINVMVGQEWKSERAESRVSTSKNFPGSFTINDVIKFTNVGEAQPNTIDIPADENMLSFFGRINYTMAEKYLATFTFRADGSSLFADGHRWGYFPSLALAWRMSDENFLKDVKWLSNLKLRLSIGTAGNNRIPQGLYETYYKMSVPTDRNPFFNNTEATALTVSTKNLYNEKLKWETTITRNVGLDFGFFRSRINGTLDLYWNTTKDLLMRTIIPGSSGFEYQYQNFGQTSNQGVELTVNGVIVSNSKLNLNANFNIAYNKNKIDKLTPSVGGLPEWQQYTFGGYQLSDQDVWSIKEGGALGEVWGYKYAGFYTVYDATTGKGDLILQNGKWIMADGSTPALPANHTLQPGLVKYVDQYNDGKITTADKVRLGNTIPKWTGGFGFDAQYKTKIGTFDMNVFCNFSLGNKILNATKMQNSYNQGTKNYYNLISEVGVANRYTWLDPVNGLNLVKGASKTEVIDYYGGEQGVMDRLNELNANATIYNPLANTGTVVTDQFFEDASFLRIQNVTIGYTLNQQWLKPLHLSSLRVYFTAYNLATITGYSGYDPEVDISSKKNAMCPGVDYAAYPKSRSYTVGLNVSF